MIWVFAIVIFLVLGYIVLAWAKPRLKAMEAEDKAFFERYHRREQEIAVLTFEEARAQGELLLSDPSKFDCIPAPPALDALEALAPGLQSLFSRFASVQAVNSEACLSRDLIAPFGWGWKDGPWHEYQFWQIGTDYEHVVILVKPHQEGIYATDGDDDLEEPDYPSVYHWLLSVTSDFGPDGQLVDSAQYRV